MTHIPQSDAPVPSEPSADEVDSTIEKIAGECDEARRALAVRDYRRAVIHLEAVRYLAHDMEQACERLERFQ